jgi:hypothetical protein
MRQRGGVAGTSKSAKHTPAQQVQRLPVLSAPLTPAELSKHIQGGDIRLVPVLPSTAEEHLAYAALHVVTRRRTIERVYEVPDTLRDSLLGQVTR